MELVMLVRLMVASLALLSASCAPGPPHPLVLYPDATEVRLFADPTGFQFPEGVALEQSFDRGGGAVLSADEAAVVARAVTVVPPPDAVTACEHTWRHVFVFYQAEGPPLGALALCMECGAVTIIGPADPNVSFEQLRYDGAALREIVETHGMVVKELYPE
jgi:hypothetical protein